MNAERSDSVIAIDRELFQSISSATSVCLKPTIVYTKAAYLWWPEFGPVVLLNREQSPQPWSILTTVKEFSPMDVSSAVFRKGILVWGRRVLTLDVEPCQLYDSGVPDLSEQWNLSGLHEVCRLAWGRADVSVFHHLDSLSDMMSSRVESLFQHLVYGEQHDLEKSVRALVGFGLGTTPSGDDFLTGVLCALAGRCRGEFDLLAKILQKMDLLKYQLTTVPGATLLWHACHGRFARVVTDALRAVNGVGDIAEASARLLDVGHTSGRDLLAGIVIGSEWNSKCDTN